MTNPNGNILNFYCELPHHLDIAEIGSTLLELNLAVTGISESPVASVSTHYAIGNSIEALEAEIEDYRRFYVEFEPSATKDDAVRVVGIVFDALKRVSSGN